MSIHRNTFIYCGLLLSSVDSFPIFSSISTYAPFFSILCFFIYLCFDGILTVKWKKNQTLLLLSICTILLLYSFYKGCFIYGELKGFISFFIQFICTFILFVSFNVYFTKLSYLNPYKYCESFSNLFIKAHYPIIIIGVVELFLINYPSIYTTILSFISHRVSLERIQLVSGEPSWASRLILTILVFIPFTSFKRKKKIIIYAITLLLLFFTGSSLGIISYIIFILLTYLKRENTKWIFVIALVTLMLFPYLFGLLDSYTQKRLYLLSNLYNEDWFSIAVNSGSGSIMSRIGNPILGIYMGLEHWFLGVGGGYYSFFYTSYLESYFPEALNIENIHVVGNSAKNLFCRIIAEFGLLVLLYITILLFKLYNIIIRYNRKLKSIFVCMLILTINFDSLFHIYPILLFCFITNYPTKYVQKAIL